MSLILPAPAKINLGLEVLGRRDDGLHELRTLMVSIDLADLVTITDDGRFSIDGPAAADLPADAGRDLAWRALQSLESAAGRSLGLGLRVHKRIPPGAGLGGGSADAGAVLRAAPALGLRLARQEMLGLAMPLGADVPFQLRGGMALVGGAGELVRPLPYRRLWLALAIPRFSCSTAEVFAELRQEEWGGDDRLDDVAQAMMDRGVSDSDLRKLVALLPNALLPAATRRYPELVGFRETLQAMGWRPQLTGSGGAMFHVCESGDEAARLAGKAQGAGLAARACRSVPALAP